MGSSGTALGLIGIILAAGAIGFSFFVWNGQNTASSDLDDLTTQLNDLESDFNNLNMTILVGVWEDHSRNQDYAPHTTNRNWLFEFEDNQLTNTEYLSVSNTNTRITINKAGWYKIHLSTLLSSINDGSVYYMRFYKNTVIYGFTSYLIGDLPFIYMDGTVFIECNATDFIEIGAYSVTDDFNTYTLDNYNHLTIEYVVI